MSIEADHAARLLAWFDRHGRHDLPWQHPRTPYRVWLSEIMLQQTQVAVVIPYFERFIAALPDLPSLAHATQDEVLALWSGLGYYARARNLHAAAKRCVELHDGELPRDLDALLALPGIGRSTAGAILSQAWGDPAPILDGNVKRVLSRLFGIQGWPGTPAIEKRLWAIAESLLPDAQLADYTQAQMDFGATLCTRADPALAETGKSAAGTHRAHAHSRGRRARAAATPPADRRVGLAVVAAGTCGHRRCQALVRTACRWRFRHRAQRRGHRPRFQPLPPAHPSTSNHRCAAARCGRR